MQCVCVCVYSSVMSEAARVYILNIHLELHKSEQKSSVDHSDGLLRDLWGAAADSTDTSVSFFSLFDLKCKLQVRSDEMMVFHFSCSFVALSQLKRHTWCEWTALPEHTYITVKDSNHIMQSDLSCFSKCLVLRHTLMHIIWCLELIWAQFETSLVKHLRSLFNLRGNCELFCLVFVLEIFCDADDLHCLSSIVLSKSDQMKMMS